MVPAAVVDPVLKELSPLLRIRRHRRRRREFALRRRHSARQGTRTARGIHYLDVGVSGGVWGDERGYCLMIGGSGAAVAHLDPIFKTLAPGFRPRPDNGTRRQKRHRGGRVSALRSRWCGALRENPNAVSATAEPAMLDHGRPCHSDCSAPDHPGEPTSKSRVREPGAAAAVGGLPSYPSEAQRSLVRPAVLGRPPAGLAGLEVGLDDRTTRHGYRVASPRLRVVLDPTVAAEGRPSAGRRRGAAPDPRDGPSEPTLGRRAFTASC